MSITLSVGPLISLVAGILILIVPKLLNYIVAAYLILIGLVGIVGTDDLHVRGERAHASFNHIRT